MNSINEFSLNNEPSLNYILKNVFGSFYKARKHLFVGIVVGVTFGIIFWMVATPEYSSKLVGYSETLSDKRIKDEISDITLLFKFKDHEAISKMLGMSINNVKKVKSVECFTDLELTKSIKNPETFFTIQAVVYDNLILDTLEKALCNYLENNEYVHVRKMNSLDNYYTMINKINIERLYIDSLKSLVLVKLNDKDNRTMNLVGANLNVLSETSLGLQGRLIDQKNNIKFIDDVNIIKKFKPITKPIHPRGFVSILFGLIFGLVAGFIWFGFTSIRSKNK